MLVAICFMTMCVCTVHISFCCRTWEMTNGRVWKRLALCCICLKCSVHCICRLGLHSTASYVIIFNSLLNMLSHYEGCWTYSALLSSSLNPSFMKTTLYSTVFAFTMHSLFEYVCTVRDTHTYLTFIWCTHSLAPLIYTHYSLSLTWPIDLTYNEREEHSTRTEFILFTEYAIHWHYTSIHAM